MTTPDRISALKGTAGAMLCLALTAGIFIAGDATIRDREASVGSDFTLEVPDADLVPDVLPEAGPEIGAEEDIPSNSDGAGAGTLPATGPDEGAAGDGAAATPISTTPLARPIVLAAGRLSFSGSVVELDGIEPVAIERKCKTASDEAWPCGRMARTAFANYVRGRTVECTVPGRTWSGTVQARCTLGGTDLSQWLADNGWAEASSGSGLEDAAGQARAAGRGLYGQDLRRRRPVALPDTTTVEPQDDSIGISSE